MSWLRTFHPSPNNINAQQLAVVESENKRRRDILTAIFDKQSDF